jgi:hypothetical protein
MASAGITCPPVPPPAMIMRMKFLATVVSSWNSGRKIRLDRISQAGSGGE